MPNPPVLIPIPRSVLLGVGALAVIVVLTLAPVGWRAGLLTGTAALLVVAWRGSAHRRALREASEEHSRTVRGVEARREDARTHADAMTAVVHATPTPTLVVRDTGHTAMGNPSAGTLFGTTPDELPGRELEELIPQPELMALFDQARGGSPSFARLRLVVNSAPRYFDVTCTPIRASLFAPPPHAPPPHAPDPSEPPEGWAVVVCLEDVTSVGESVQLKSDFAANASHELRTPIAAIRGAVETLELAHDDPEMTRKLSSMIARHARRLEELVADLLDLSRLESEQTPMNAERVELPELTARLTSHSESTRAAREIGLAFDWHPDLNHLRLDPGVLELILRNLIENACKFAHPGSVVRVEGIPMEVSPAIGPDPNPVFDKNARGVGFRVIDQGIGIPMKDQERVFERFFQVDQGRDAQRTHRGTGLGLAIVKHAVRRLSGRVTIQSVLHEGTTVTLEFPHCIWDEAPPTVTS